MKNTDIVNAASYDPDFDDNLVLVQRDGTRITLEDYIGKKVAEQVEKRIKMGKITAEKVVVTYAEVRYNGWDYKVWPNHNVEKWVVTDDNVDGYWSLMSPYDDGYEEIVKAGLEVLREQGND